MRSSINLEPEIYADKIFYYKKIIPDSEFIVRLIEKMEPLLSNEDIITPWQVWESSDAGYQFGYTKHVNAEKINTASHDAKYVYGSIISAVRISAKHYFNVREINPGVESPISISKYSEGKFMGAHTDERSGAYISAVVYLNDNYEGGELGFPNQGFSIKPEAGSMIIFPSTDPFTHDPRPAYGAERYICPIFWYN